MTKIKKNQENTYKTFKPAFSTLAKKVDFQWLQNCGMRYMPRQTSALNRYAKSEDLLTVSADSAGSIYAQRVHDQKLRHTNVDAT